MVLKEVRIHGRGGQGAVTSAQALAIAAAKDGKFTQSFPTFGVERSGAPVEAYTRISDEFINRRQHVYNPQYVIVLDTSLISVIDVTKGVAEDGLIIVNSSKNAEELGLKGAKSPKGAKVHSIDITKIALDVIGKPFVNLAALGAFAALTGEISIESIKKAVEERMGKLAELNNKALDEVYKIAGEMK